jgi:hypothetical protein
MLSSKLYYSWSVEEDKKLLELRNNSKSFYFIANKMHRTKESVRTRYWKLIREQRKQHKDYRFIGRYI